MVIIKIIKLEYAMILICSPSLCLRLMMQKNGYVNEAWRGLEEIFFLFILWLFVDAAVWREIKSLQNFVEKENEGINLLCYRCSLCQDPCHFAAGKVMGVNFQLCVLKFADFHYLPIAESISSSIHIKSIEDSFVFLDETPVCSRCATLWFRHSGCSFAIREPWQSLRMEGNWQFLRD